MTTESSTGQTIRPLLEWLLEQYPDTPKKRAKQWITAGRVSVDGVIIRRPNQRITGPPVTVTLLDRRVVALDCSPDGWQFHPRVNLLYLDTALAVVNKAPGLLSVSAQRGRLSALGILTDLLTGKLRARDGGTAVRTIPPAYRRLHPLPVHRLDQYTSGLFCMAMNPAARVKLIDQLKAHTMQREYVAYVGGRVPAPQGTWRNWLKLGEDELRQSVVAAAEATRAGDEIAEAITHYEVLTEFPVAGGTGVITKLRLRLETGRKHQIRVQAAHAGLPLVGDRTYHARYHRGVPKAPRIDFPRQALHADVLSLEHPNRSGQRMTWTAPLPEDLQQLEARLRSTLPPRNHWA